MEVNWSKQVILNEIKIMEDTINSKKIRTNNSKDFISRYDQNKDGKIDLDDVKSFYQKAKSMFPAGSAGLDIEQIFKDHDKDGDGFLC